MGIQKEIFFVAIFFNYCLGDNMRIKKEYSKVYFWTSTLNDHLTRKIKTSFKSYWSAFNLVSDWKQFEEDKMDKDSDVFKYYSIIPTFAYSSFIVTMKSNF